MDYVSLHTHTTFSVLDAAGTPAQLVERAKELGHEAIAITEHGHTSSHPKLEMACKKAGIKPIYGCEFYVGEEGQREKEHLTVLARNREGYGNLLRLTNLAYTEQRFYYQPTIRLSDLLSNSGQLIVLSGCLSGPITKRILEDDMEGAREVAQKLAAGIEHFFIEIQPLELEESQKANEGLIKLAHELGIELVATNDVHYLEPGDEQVQQFLTSIRVKKKAGLMDSRCYLATGEEMVAWGSPAGAVENTAKIAQLCEAYELPKTEPVKSEIENPYEVMVEKCREGWRKRRLGEKENWEEYRDRAIQEFELIKSKDYQDYFLMVADMVQWAKDQGIMVGPARGSVAGSLVAFLLEITEVDPIRWGLLLERFIDPNRFDYPDIDLDFQHDRRDEVKQYVQEKYGMDKVANIAGYSTLKPRALMDDMQRVYNIPKTEVENAKKELEDEGGDLPVPDVIRKYWPELEHVTKAEDMMRQFTLHAAGMIVANEPLRNFITVGRDDLALLDYRDAEYLGFIKLDILSLKGLTVIDYILKEIGKDSHWLYNEVPIDDPETYQGFCDGDLEGIFQFEGGTVRRVCSQVKPRDFMELGNVNALSRPIPLQTGATEAYVNDEYEFLHEGFEKHTGYTKGQILYQEQIMKLLRELGNISWEDVGLVRKYISKYRVKKSRAEEQANIDFLNRVRDEFIENFQGDKALAAEIWERFGKSGGYGFNIAHCISYTTLSYYTMYLKKHYPLEFYWANMVVEPDNKAILREYVRKGGKIYGVKFGKSKANWTIDREKQGLRAGYLSLKGIGPKGAEKLENGEIPKGKAKAILEGHGAFEEKDEPVDFLGLERLREKLEAVPARDKIADIVPDEMVRIAGKPENFKFTNLRKLLLVQGQDYEAEVTDRPENTVYVHLELTDETGTVTVNINRHKYADETIREMLENIGEDDIMVITGQYSHQMGKVYAARIRVM